MLHQLKIKEKYYKEVNAGTKTFEVRKNDRPFVVGDFLALNKIDDNGEYTGDWILAKIVYILADEEFCKDGYVVLGIQKEASYWWYGAKRANQQEVK